MVKTLSELKRENIQGMIESIQLSKQLNLGGLNIITFDPEKHIKFNSEFLDFHANGMKFSAFENDQLIEEEVFFSIGGGFIVQEKDDENAVEHQNEAIYPFPIQTAEQLADYCITQGRNISEIVYQNEQILRSPSEIDRELQRIWDTMLECMYLGCHTEGILPGGLNVRRRAYDSYQKLKGDQPYETPEEWIQAIRKTEVKFRQILKWVSCYALAVNEVNASLGRVVTAPTNGSAGVYSSSVDVLFNDRRSLS